MMTINMEQNNYLVQNVRAPIFMSLESIVGHGKVGPAEHALAWAVAFRFMMYASCDNIFRLISDYPDDV